MVVWASEKTIGIMDRDNLIRDYFLSGLRYAEIVAFLFLRHGIDISLLTLKRRLKVMNLSRKKDYSDLTQVIKFIGNELETSGQLCGYRWMHRRCIQNGLVVTLETVRISLQELDPEGVECRRRRRLRRRKYGTKGPNFIWHIDAYDKLTPYGIAISGCIDGYSRHIMWLRAGRTASNPRIIGGYYIDTLKKYGGCPRRIRFDHGTENVGVEKFQIILREHPFDEKDSTFGEKSVLYGTSQCNQRIESWWSMLRKHSAQFWMNLFQQLKDDDQFTGSDLDKALIQFCFMKIVQEELDQISFEWNTHSISGSKNAVSPRGRPVIMFEMPELYNTENFLCTLDIHVVEACEKESLYYRLPCQTDIYELCRTLMIERNMTIPTEAYSAVDVYVKLKDILNREFEIQ